MVSPYHGAKIKSHYEVHSSALSGKGPLLSFRPQRPVRVVCFFVFFHCFGIFHVRFWWSKDRAVRKFCFFLSRIIIFDDKN